jgi:hypothetical protein
MNTNTKSLPIVAVADLHGHPDHLKALLARLDEELGDEYELVTLGDYVDNGPDVPGLLDLLIELQSSRGHRFRPILGNHDLACLRTLGWPGESPDPQWYSYWAGRFWSDRGTPAAYGATGAAEFARRIPRAHVDFLRALPWYHESGEYFFVHAGLHEGPIEPQRASLENKELPSEHLHSPSRLRDKSLSVVHDATWDRVVVSGHTKQPAKRAPGGHRHAPHFMAERRICLSGELDQTGRLFAMILPERRLIEVGADLSVTIEPPRPRDEAGTAHPKAPSSSAAASASAASTDPIARARTRTLAAGGKVSVDREGRGRLVLKLPRARASVAAEVAALVGGRVEEGEKYLVVVGPSLNEESGAASSTELAPPAQVDPESALASASGRGYLAGLTDRLADARQRLVHCSAAERRAAEDLVKNAETLVRSDPDEAFEFAGDGSAILTVAKRRFSAGRFTTRSIRELRAEAKQKSGGPTSKKRARLSILRGTDGIFGIGALQAGAEDGTLFQVASQFNCLEAPGPHVVPVSSYFSDSTQGPRASISAFPGTLLRHYAAPSESGRFVQKNDGRQLDLLADALDPHVGRVVNGYLTSASVTDPGALAGALEDRFEQIRVGVHADVEVVLGASWGGPVPNPAPRVAQVFTSTLALGGYSSSTGSLTAACRPLLRAAYLGTLLAALSIGARRVVLTLIGGGAFGNRMDTIWEAIEWSLAEVDDLCPSGGLDVVLNSRDGLTGALLESAVAEAHGRGGVIVESDRSTLFVG